MPESGRGRAGRQPRGASGGQSRLRQLIWGYARHHRETLMASLARLAAAPLQSLLTMLVIAIALALPATLHTAVDNLRQLGGEIESSARMTVFLRHGIPAAEIDTLLATLRAYDEVADVTLVTPDEALAEFSANSGLGDALDLLEANPLPAVMMVEPEQGFGASPDDVAGLARRIGEQTQVDEVAEYLAWLQRLQALLDIGGQLANALGVALGLGVLVIIGNTIRLGIENRRDEIVVVKLVGGTNGYVRRPFLYGGLWFGLGGGLLAWGLVWALVLLVAGAVDRLASLYQSGFSLSGPGFPILLMLLAAGGLLGLAGAWIAVSRHLARIEPE